MSNKNLRLNNKKVVLTDKGINLIDSIDKEASSKYLFSSIFNMEDMDINNLLKCLEKLIEQMNTTESMR